MIWEHLPAPPSAPCLLTGTPASHLISQSLLDSVYEAWLVDYKAHLETTQCLCVSVSNLVYELACFHFSQGILCFFLAKLFWKATLKIFFHPFFFQSLPVVLFEVFRCQARHNVGHSRTLRKINANIYFMSNYYGRTTVQRSPWWKSTFCNRSTQKPTIQCTPYSYSFTCRT